MEARLNYFQAEPKIMAAVIALNEAVNASGLDKMLLHLVKLRASQINGCSYCVDMHSREARADGESEQRLYLVAAWRESPLFTRKERAALAWTETLTLVAANGVSDAAYEDVANEFEPAELTRLTVAISMINTWNRICVSARSIHPVVNNTALAASA